MLVIGEKEQTAGTVAVRGRSEGDQGAMAIAEFVRFLQREVDYKRLPAGVG
ncbi:MAG: His/Gly/Thr/Pro-type tRNA ligase C-terminal domain-containing protein [Gemmataceae bacterium]